LLEAVSPGGNGVLVYVRYGDSLASGAYPIITPGDTVARWGALVAVRYMLRDIARSFTVDSGAVEVRRGPRELAARVAGSGLDAAVRTPVRAEYSEVPLPADTVPCRAQP
jgi:hypothetical protein